MIRIHDFNTQWWGKPVGVIDHLDWFSLPLQERNRQLNGFAWVEFSTRLAESRQALKELHTAGFIQVDTQVDFKLNLKKVPDSVGLQELDVHFANEKPFEVNETLMADFTHERYSVLPEISQERVNQRFALWSKHLIEASPQTCFQITHNGAVQGWFLSQSHHQKGINLTLAMLSNCSTLSGMYIYQKALRAYADRGHSLGWASFSISNSPVHNIYAKLGAHFLPPRGNWLWLA